MEECMAVLLRFPSNSQHAGVRFPSGAGGTSKSTHYWLLMTLNEG